MLCLCRALKRIVFIDLEKKKAIILCVAVALTVCFVTYFYTSNYMLSQVSGNEIRIGAGNYDDLEKYMEIGDLENIIEQYYFRESTDDDLVDGALKGMVSSLGDPYSTYYTEDEYKDFTMNSEGLFVGVGVTATPASADSGYLKVLNVYKGGPAEEAGIGVGDIIMAVDGVNIAEMDFEGALDLMAGPSGSRVVLTVATGVEAREVHITRGEIQAPFVFYSMLDERVGYITISEFKGNCVEEFAESLQKLEEEEEALGVVIDLRGNFGGLVKSATDILDLIMPEGLLSISIGKDGERTEVYSDSDYNDIPLALVVDNSTASASEIFAAAVQDGARGMVAGVKTYGKGVAQAVVGMPYSGGGVKLSTAEYYSPSGNQINIVGITPDIEAEMPVGVEVLSAESDPQLMAAKAAVDSQLGG